MSPAVNRGQYATHCHCGADLRQRKPAPVYAASATGKTRYPAYIDRSFHIIRAYFTTCDRPGTTRDFFCRKCHQFIGSFYSC